MKNNGSPLPNGWMQVKLEDVCEIILGQSPPSSTYRKRPDGLPFFQGKADFGDVSPTPTTWCVKPHKIAEVGDILISVRAPVGPTNIANTRCCIGRGLAALRCQDSIDRDFLLAGLKLYESEISRMGTGSTFKAITGKQLKALIIPLPPLSEQKRIAAILNDHMADIARTRAAAEAQLEAAEALSAAYVQEIFEGNEAKKWPKVRLGDHASKIGSGVTPRGGQSAYKPEGIPLIRSQNIYLNKFVPNGLVFIDQEQDQKMRNSRVEKGDVLLNITGASIGRVCVVPDQICPANVNQHVSIIRTGILNPYYLSSYMSNPVFQSFIMNSQSGATRQALTKTMIENFFIPCPPTKIQLRIVKDILHRTKISEKIANDLRLQIQTIDAIPSALLNKAFNGEL